MKNGRSGGDDGISAEMLKSIPPPGIRKLVKITVIEIWKRYSKQMQLAFLDFEAAFESPYRGCPHNMLRADGVPGKGDGEKNEEEHKEDSVMKIKDKERKIVAIREHAKLQLTSPSKPVRIKS
ncbi:hypothetical protein RB195_011137 [Necator americanus]|uniref:Uncharacterized protein n=1 Tax=Necator americanus TaxID=51031 RepID=A0ABR1D1X7_NECAM